MSTHLSPNRCLLRIACLMPAVFFLSGCGLAVVGALGGAGALTYEYASTKKSATAAEAPPVDRPPADAPTAKNPFGNAQASKVSFDHGSSVGQGAEAAERPGTSQSGNGAEQGLPGTIAGNLAYNQSEYNSPANPFAASMVQPSLAVALNGLTSVTTFAVQQQANGRTVVQFGQ
jgi:hypothetical protein